MQMDISLHVRIGLNTGGPIIAGVLGNENRVFDIIGDAINVAARLPEYIPAEHNRDIERNPGVHRKARAPATEEG
jgi:class 3 adenylate cyclase